MIRVILLNLIFTITLAAQSKAPIGKIGDFSSATSISINNTGFIYVADAGNNEISKYDTLGNLIKSVGGYGWGIDQFDSPTDIFTNTLKVYVADKNNNRILLYDKDLNYISALNSEDVHDPDYTFAYPVSCGVSNQGDLFILDSDNARILKFDLNGNFLNEIGGADAGSFVLTEPTALTIAPFGDLFVAEKNKVFVFDQFGNGLLKFTLNEKITNLNFSNGYLALIVPEKVKIYSFNQIPEFVKSFDFNQKGIKLRDVFIFNSKIYILTNSKILLFPFNTQ